VLIVLTCRFPAKGSNAKVARQFPHLLGEIKAQVGKSDKRKLDSEPKGKEAKRAKKARRST
jgi:hypothetical protein